MLRGGIVVIALILTATSSFTQVHPSARIYSLGAEHVSGIIPDLYTDLTVNPAYACLADRLTINYERKGMLGFAPVFPFLNQWPTYYYTDSYYSNEISFYGIGLSSWRAALFAQWRVGLSEYTRSRFDLWDGYRRAIQRHEWDSEDNDFGRIDIMAARPIGDTYALGFRLQGWGFYKSESFARIDVANSYYNTAYLELSDNSKEQDALSSLGRRLAFDFQTGIVKKSAGEPQTDLVLQASLHPIDYRDESYDLSILREYDIEQHLTDYSYSRDVWSDARKGDLWMFGLALRHAFPRGIRIYAGGSLSTATYDAVWSESGEYYGWGDYSSSDRMLTGNFDCRGSLRGASCFIKGGRMFNLHRMLDLHLGLHAAVERKHAKESPTVHYSYAIQDGDSIRIDQPASLEYTGTTADVYLPISIEFRPSSYVSFFSGFTLFAGWFKHVTVQPMPSLFSYNRPYATYSKAGPHRAGTSSGEFIYPGTSVTDYDREWTSDSTVTLGFSLHYRDRFFIDVYSHAEIIPRYLSDSMLDIRYVF